MKEFVVHVYNILDRVKDRCTRLVKRDLDMVYIFNNSNTLPFQIFSNLNSGSNKKIISIIIP